ncbi:SusC/RagA family TonB-linked outer membrane protein [Mucilaginibacter gotjawali]|uniref:TonB-linked SusC/RagA family outer membrane protein n=2 Tax=Mucilaginibacter gotjawali TaxID=1550579 RepID=A0A839S8X4_9SPHI|nr:SusC/RagA family TonB-linked outer membrane protein [Mucilaginibacter gotjawali]MBB3053804.1 TonB-linked SusC/RagA family outer membrane protein [Mucilaginibacter gotjawali]BAU54066.1 TonB-dependent Receptor Plug Domain protein [Mucilaginibacter gotjawali]
MKIFRLLLFLICLLTTGSLFAQQQQQPITLSLKNVPLETVLTQIKKQTGISFFYSKEILIKAGKVSVQVDKKDLQTTLTTCLQNTPVTYMVVGNIIVLVDKHAKKNADGTLELNENMFSQVAVHGFVYNLAGTGLNGASVVIKRTHLGTTTNANGEFSLGEVRTNDTIRVSFIGYDAQDVAVAQGEFNIKLKETKNELDAVEVQAYGTTTKRLAMGEISQVNAADIERQPVSNPLLALKSIVPGLLITPTTGFGNSPVRVEIRGRNSIDPSSMSDPLYIIDGIPLVQTSAGLVNTGYQTGANLQQAGISSGMSPFAALNPNDIESITVLKDATATAMYGSRAGNGVIIITTKRGKAGKTVVDVTASHEINRTIGHYDMLNTTQYLQMRREALRNDGLTASTATAPDLTLWDTTRNVDWQKQLWKSTSGSTVRATISGGNELSTFRVSGSYQSLQDISPLTNQNTDAKSNIAFNFSHHSPDQKLTVDVSTIFGHNKINQISIGGATTMAPDLPPIFDKNGNLNYTDWNAAGIGSSFPFGSLLQPFVTSSDLLNGSLRLGYQIIKGLNANISVGYNLGLMDNRVTNTIASQNPLYNPTALSVFGNSRTDGWNITPQIDYTRYIGKGKLTVLAGANLNSSSASGLSTYAYGYTSDELIKSVNNAPFVQSQQGYAQSKYVDVHGSLNYNWEGKYIAEVSGNRDGSSNFGPGREFGSFGVAGVSWVASEEQWLKKSLPSWVSLLKLKVSYGTTGNYPGVAYQYLSQWANSSFSGGSPLYTYNGIVPQVPIHAVNQDYRWETDKELNTGLDIGLLDDRISLHAALYRKRTNDQLAMIPTPAFTGFNNVEGNSQAEVQNSGVEIALNARIVDTKDFTWSSALNFSHNENKLLAFPGIQYTSYYTTQKVGYSVNEVFLLHYLGVDPQTGQRSYQDLGGGGYVSLGGTTPPGGRGDSRSVAIDLSPKFETSWVNRFAYKGFRLDLQFAYRKMMAMEPYAYLFPGSFNNNIPLSIYNNHWQKPGDISTNPRLTTLYSANSDNDFAQSDGAYTDGSYLRLQNVALSYALPDRLAKKMGVQGISLMVSMENVFTITKYPGIDPELPFGNQPQAKTFNGQLTLTF